MKRYSAEEIQMYLSMCKTEEEKNFFTEADDPVTWAEHHLWHPDSGDEPFIVKSMFRDLLRDGRKDRAARVGRQCLAEGTVIHTRDGQLIPIEQHPDAWLTGEHRNIYKVKAWGGYTLYATENHPLRTSRGWVKVEDLLPNDELMVLARWNKWGCDSIPYDYIIRMGSIRHEHITGTYNVTQEHAELLGWLTANGTGLCPSRGSQCRSVKFTNTNQEYVNRVKHLVGILFPTIEPRLYAKGKGVDLLLTTPSRKQGQNPLKHFLRCMGFDTHGFPTAVATHFSKECVIAFFRGMYPSDGYTHYKPGQKYECGLACGNDHVYAQYVRELLNKLGIRAQLKSEHMAKASEGAIFNRVVFSGSDNARAFLDTIGDIMGKKLPRISVTQAKPSRVRNITTEVDGESVFFSPLLSVEPAGVSRVWDITVPDKGWFIAGGIVTHNSGKTVHMVVDIMHIAAHDTDAIILVFIPEKKQMNRMLEIMKNLLRNSDIKGAFRFGAVKQQKSDIEPQYDYEIGVSSGSVIRFFFMGHNPDKARGQRGTHLYMDEVEYFPEKAFPVILGIPKSNPSIKIWASSTPSGLEGTWFREFCDKCSDPKNVNGEEYHLPTTLEENWEEVRDRLKDLIFDEVTWKLEVLAEWAEVKGAVYKKEIVDLAISRSLMNGIRISSSDLLQTLEYQNAQKFLGVDWNNPQNGVRLVEIARMYGAPWVIRNEVIAYQEYTQLSAVNRIMELFKQNKYKVISVDAGYGETQIELLHKELVANGFDPRKILNIVDSNKSEDMVIRYTSPVTGARRTDQMSVRVKNKIVGMLAKLMEDSLVLLKEEEDKPDGLIKEIRNFKRKSANTMNSSFQYSDDTHSLSALQICVHGYVKFLTMENRDEMSTVESIKGTDIQDIIRARTSSFQSSPIIRSPFGGRSLHSRTQGLSHGRQSRSVL